MAKPQLLKLPSRDAPNYIDVVLKNVIEAYKFFQSDSMALDYCAVTGTTRAIILDHPEYKTQTRFIRADKYLEEIEEVQQLTKDLRSTEPTDTDFRDSRDPDKDYQKQYKDWFAMRLKTAEMRRELLSLSRKDDEGEEANVLNVYFVPISREEFEQLKNVDINDGEQDAGSAFDDDSSSSAPTSVKAAMETIKDSVLEGGYKINEDDTVEDW